MNRTIFSWFYPVDFSKNVKEFQIFLLANKPISLDANDQIKGIKLYIILTLCLCAALITLSESGEDHVIFVSGQSIGKGGRATIRL